MATVTVHIALGVLLTGKTLNAQLVNTDGTASGSVITSGFVEIGTGHYEWTNTNHPSGFRGLAKFYEQGVSGTVLAAVAFNPEELSSGTGSGDIAYTITVVDDAAAAVPSVRLTLRNAGDSAEIAFGYTDNDGVLVFNVQAGDYLILVESSAIYEPLDPVEDTVSGTSDSKTITLTRATSTSVGNQLPPSTQQPWA
jgi:hypothetical protein